MPLSHAAVVDGVVLVGKLIGADMNSTADQAIQLSLPPGVTKYRMSQILAVNPSISLTTCKGGIYAAASKSNPVTSTSTTFDWSPLTTNALNVTGSVINAGLNLFIWNVTTIYLSLTTPQGVAATCDIYVYIQPLY